MGLYHALLSPSLPHKNKETTPWGCLLLLLLLLLVKLLASPR